MHGVSYDVLLQASATGEMQEAGRHKTVTWVGTACADGTTGPGPSARSLGRNGLTREDETPLIELFLEDAGCMYFLRRLHGGKLLSVNAMLNYGDDEHLQREEQGARHVLCIVAVAAHMTSGLQVHSNCTEDRSDLLPWPSVQVLLPC